MHDFNVMWLEVVTKIFNSCRNKSLFGSSIQPKYSVTNPIGTNWMCEIFILPHHNRVSGSKENSVDGQQQLLDEILEVQDYIVDTSNKQ